MLKKVMVRPKFSRSPTALRTWTGITKKADLHTILKRVVRFNGYIYRLLGGWEVAGRIGKDNLKCIPLAQD